MVSINGKFITTSRGGFKELSRILARAKKAITYLTLTSPYHLTTYLLHRVWKPEGEGEKIHLLAMEPVTISSTEIRQRVRVGLTLNGWVPAAVAKYILAHGLYTRARAI